MEGLANKTRTNWSKKVRKILLEDRILREKPQHNRWDNDNTYLEGKREE